MSRFIDEGDRTQGTLLPGTIDEYVSEENPVRVIEAFVDALDLGEHLRHQRHDPGVVAGLDLLAAVVTAIGQCRQVARAEGAHFKQQGRDTLRQERLRLPARA